MINLREIYFFFFIISIGLNSIYVIIFIYLGNRALYFDIPRPVGKKGLSLIFLMLNGSMRI